MANSTTHDPYEPFKFSSFRYLIAARFLATIAVLMIETVLGWHLYDKTGSKFVLGLLGLLEILPVLLFSLYAGQLADRKNRQKMALTAQCGFLLAGTSLAVFSFYDLSVHWIYIAVVAIGTARAFNFPAAGTLLVRTVPKKLFSSAAAWSSNFWQMAAVLGPMLGGLMISVSHSATTAYCVASAILLLALVSLSQMKLLEAPESKPTDVTQNGILEGFLFLKRNQLLLSIISLDLFAVFFGGAVALLPVYAKDILNIGPQGLGWLRAAPSIGAVLSSLYIAHRPPFRHAGITLLWAIAGFGLATVVFGFSTWPLLSFCMLFLTGVFDSISVIIRSTLLLVSVPDSMRGRVSAINSIFVGSSNELGAFESGSMAGAFGTVFAVVSGGIVTLLVVGITALKFPELRNLREIQSKKDEPGVVDVELTGTSGLGGE